MKNKVLALLIGVCFLLGFSACRTISHQPKIEVVIPKFEAVRPSIEPLGLVELPLTTGDLLNNSLCYEFAFYEWQDYAMELESYIEQLKERIKSP